MYISWFHRLLDTLSPRACAACGETLGATEEGLCSVCNRHLPRTEFWTEPYDNVLARLLWGRVPVEKCAALFFYRSHSEASRMIYALKYGHRPDIGTYLGRMAATDFDGSGFFDGIDAMIPVPLTKGRERERGYNQSTMIARGISEMTGIPVWRNVVRRTSYNGSQTQKVGWERIENVRGAFSLTNGKKIRGRHILIVDDIITTGATVWSCARELLKAGDVRLSVMSAGFACDPFKRINHDIESHNAFGLTIDDFYLDELLADL